MNRISKKSSRSIFVGVLVSLASLLTSTSAPLADYAQGFYAQPKAEQRFPAHLGGVPLQLISEKAALSLTELAEIVLLPAEVEAASADRRPVNLDTMPTSAIVKGVFGSVAIPMSNFPVSARWRPIFQKINLCASKNPCLDQSALFQRVVQKSSGTGFRDKLAIVNRGVNAFVKYKRDKAVYGVADHWATPEETLARGAGDCEDYAILKMAGLSRAGIPAQSMSLVVLQDKQRGVFHAVLSVATSQGTFILDNLSDRVLLDTELGSYQPLYSLSTNRAWIHGSKAADKKIASISGEFRSIAPGEGIDPMVNGPERLANSGGFVLRQGLSQ